MRFPPHILDEIRSRLPVSAVVGRKVALKKQGREFRGLSPFKAEKTPSFFVNDQKGFYHCFASGEHGDIFTFLMKTEGLSFPEAIERLAADAGVSLPQPTERDRLKSEARARHHEVQAAAARYFRDQLNGPGGGIARAYLDKRGLTADTIETFGLGYAPDGRTALIDHLTSQGFTRRELEQSGLMIFGPDIARPYDRFRNRVMFPIQDLKGRTIAFGGRALDANQPAKYLNSPETPLFHKGAQLYNAHRARQAAFDSGEMIVVEGYMDVIALAQAGYANAVAPLGTALTEDQLAILWRIVDEPVLCFDGDGAGRKAAHRAIDTALPHLTAGKTVRIAFLPEGLDPDDLIRAEGAASVAHVTSQASALADVLWQREWADGDWSAPERRARLETRLMALAQSINDPVVRTHYQRDLRNRLYHAWRERRTGPQRSAHPHAAQGRAPARPGAVSAQRPGDNRRDQPGWASRPLPRTPELSLSAMVRGNDRPKQHEWMAVRLLLDHPWLIEDEAETIAELEFAVTDLGRLVADLLTLSFSEKSLDTHSTRSQLARLGWTKHVDLVDAQASPVEVGPNGSDISSGSSPDIVRLAWSQVCDAMRRVSLSRELDEAVADYERTGDEDAMVRVLEIKRILSHLEIAEAS